MAQQHKCLGEGCNKPITWRFALCSDCEKKYGSSPLEWDEWLRFLWNDIQRERRREKRQQDIEVNMDMEFFQEGFDYADTPWGSGDDDNEEY